MPGTAVTQAAPYRLRCLGPVSLTAPDGATRKFRTRKQMGLLVLLAQKAGRPYGREQLVELLWGADEPAAARHSLAQSISIINKAFGHDAIRVAGKDQVELREGMVWLDAEEFERAVRDGRYEEARSLWRGPLLEGLWVQRAAGFDAWIDSERQRLTRMYRDVLHHEMERERAAGRWPAMRATAEGLLADDQLDEAAMLGFLESLALGGDRTLALRSFGDFERRLKDELGAEPGAPLKAWIRRQRKGEDAPAPPPMPLPRMTETQVLPAARPVYGREEEFKFLWDAWGAAQQNSGSFIIMEGQAGIGKSALATKLANQVHVMGGAVCFVRCWRTEKSVPFAPITALIRQLMRLPGFVALNEVWIGELSRLVPELRERYPAAPAPMAIDDSARHRICDGTLQAAACVADEQPLMIIVDDIHNADEATLALLHYFGRQLGSQASLLLCTARSNAAETALEHTFFDTARKLGIARFLNLGSLSVSETTRLARQVLAHRGIDLPAWAENALIRSSCGNPLQVIETAMGVPAEDAAHPQWHDALTRYLSGIESFEEASIERLRELSPSAQRLAAVLAVVGTSVSEYELGTIADLAPAEYLGAVYTLEKANFIRRNGSTIVLLHDRYQSSILESLGDQQRKEIHRAVARFLSRSAAENPAARYEVARHYESATMLHEAKKEAIRAADFAASIGAVKERAVALELACRVSCDANPELLLELGRCQLSIRDFAGVRKSCRTVRESDDLHRSQLAELSYLEAAADHFDGTDDLPRTAARIGALLEVGMPEFDDYLYAHIIHMRTLDRMGAGTAARRTARWLKKRASAQQRPLGQAYRLAATGWVLAKYYNAARALDYFRPALRLAEREKCFPLEQFCRECIPVVLNLVGRYEEALEEHQLTRLMAQRLLDPFSEAISTNNLAIVELNLARCNEADRHLAQARALTAHCPNWPFSAYAIQNHAAVLVYLQRYKEAKESFLEAHEHAKRHAFWYIAVTSAGGLGLCALRTLNLEELAHWATVIKEFGNEQAIVDRALVEITLAWDTALNGGNLEEALCRLKLAAEQMLRTDIDHSILVILEEVRLREHFGGRREEERRTTLLELARRHGLGTKYEYLLSSL